jgi:two-component system sensor histidine kinase RpfC
MIATTQWIKQRLSDRPDSEHGQAIVRLAVLFVVLVYMLVRQSLGGSVDSATAAVMVMVATGFIVGAGLLAAIVVNPGVSHVRRVIGMVSDYGLMGAAMIEIGEPLAWVYIILMWVTVGNGLRYGNRYLKAAVLAASLSFGAVILGNEYWLGNRVLAFGLLTGLVAVPLYLSGLLKQLTRATDEARRANEAKSRFLANMSHEFRTPLNGLAGTSELLATTRLDDEQRGYVSTIHASTRALLALVEDVLDISAIEAGKFKLNNEQFAVRELVNIIGLILEPAARAKQLAYEVTVSPDVPGCVHGDPAHLRQVLLNLVNNAIKFTDKGYVRLTVDAAASTQQSVRLRFTVADSGIGIPPSARAKLFEAFEQADTGLSRRHGGTGLGTTIAKGLTEAMGGSIGFESVEFAGSKFWVEVPFDLPEPRALTPSAADEPASAAAVVAAAQPLNVIAFSDPFLRHRARVRTMQVLIADDHAANRMVLQGLLQKAGHRVIAVEDGESVLNALEASEYDVVIVDLHMPGISGLDMLRQLRVMEAGSGKSTPVIVLSADVTPNSIRQCEEAGARAFIAKPIVAARLLDTMADIATSGKSGAGSSIYRPETLSKADEILDSNVLEELAALGMGNAFETEFIAQCLSDAQNCIRLLEEYAQLERWDQLKEQAHALKGVASNVGLVKLSAAGGEIMRLADWQISREWRQRATVLRDRLEQGRTALNLRAVHRAQESENETRN